MKTNCCVANGPRGFVVLLEFLLMADGDGVSVNLYVESRASVERPGGRGRVHVEQKTDYPAGGTVTLGGTHEPEAEFSLRLRIPAWSRSAEAGVNGDPVAGVRPGTYPVLRRPWKKEDTVTLRFDLGGRCRVKNHHFALERGPVLLARGARFRDGNIHEAATLPDPARVVALRPVEPGDPDVWMSFSTDLRLDSNLEAGEKARPVRFCDFASAGNTWGEESAYREWQRAPLHVMKQSYVPYNVPGDR